MRGLQEHLLKEIRPVIESWKDQDIYAISFYYYNDGEDPLLPVLVLGYNTVENYKASIGEASDSSEAKWNYAFWLQNEAYVFGYGESAGIIQSWIKGNRYDELEEDSGPEYDENFRYIGKGPAVTQKYVGELIQVCQKLHGEKIIENTFGKPIPIIIHRLEYYDAIAEQTLAANPPGVADEFAAWVMAM